VTVTEIVPAKPASLPEIPSVESTTTIADILRDALRGLSTTTILGYSGDLHRVAAWLTKHLCCDPLSVDDAIAVLCRASAPTLYATLRSAQNDWLDEGLSHATINRRVAAVRCIIRAACAAGLAQSDVRIKSLPDEPRRRNEGVDQAEVGCIYSSAAGTRDPLQAKRNLAVVRLLGDMALRRAEVLSLNIGDLELVGDRPTLRVKRKGRREKAPLPIPMPTVRALREWLEVHPDRGNPDAPAVVVRLAKAHQPGRLSAQGFYHLVKSVAGRAGITGSKARPHALRHGGITTASGVVGGDLPKVQMYSGHRSAQVTLRYIHQKKDEARKIAEAVAATFDASMGGAA
jgi:integrase/recombinase XerC